MAQDLIEDLKQQIADGKAVVVVGTGVSIGASGNAPCASWKGFLRQGIERCRAVGQPKPDDRWAGRQREALDTGDLDDLLGVAEQVERRLKAAGGEYGRWLRETVGALPLADRAVLDALRDLGTPIATTNYDGLIENVTGWPPVTWRDGDRMLRVLRGEESGVLHLHGHFAAPESVVLGIRSYESVLGNTQAQSLQQAMALFHSLVFVGYGQGLGDPNFGALLRWIRTIWTDQEHRHYRLCCHSEVAAIDEAKQDGDRWFALGYGDDHGNLAPFLKSQRPAKTAASISAPVTLASTPAVSPPALPGRGLCIGREDMVAQLAAAVTAAAPKPVAVLGSPGVGKSTIVVTAFHDLAVAAKFGRRRYVVALDGAESADAMTAAIARVLGLPPTPQPLPPVLAALAEAPAVLALDNAETPWERDVLRTEEVLAQLASVSGLALVVGLRGSQRPSGIDWGQRIDVPILPREQSRAVFLAIAGAKHAGDPHLDDLLRVLDDLPLAVTLMAHRAESEPDLAGVLQRWQRERTEILKRGPSDHRLTNLAVSIDLSLMGPRMTDSARRLFALLGLLPDGWRAAELDRLLPNDGAAAAAKLRQVGLAVDRGDRIHLLAPVREHSQRNRRPTDADLGRLIDEVSRRAKAGDRVGAEGGAEAAVDIVANAGNIEAVLLLALERNRFDTLPAVLGFAEAQRFTGVGSTMLLERACKATKARDDVLGEANCIKSLGDIALARSDHDGARKRFEEALPLYRRIGSVLGEANCIQSLGDIALERSNHDGARKRFEEALPLYRRIGAVLGEANCIKSLGDIALRRSDHDEARSRYEEALPLYRRIGAVLGEANCIKSLGDIALARSDHEGARSRYEEALPLYRRIGSVRGEANCIQSLGDIALKRSDHDEARNRFEKALHLYERISDPYSIGVAHALLAQVTEGAERRSHLAAARAAWESIGRHDLIATLPME